MVFIQQHSVGPFVLQLGRQRWGLLNTFNDTRTLNRRGSATAVDRAFRARPPQQLTRRIYVEFPNSHQSCVELNGWGEKSAPAAVVYRERTTRRTGDACRPQPLVPKRHCVKSVTTIRAMSGSDSILYASLSSPSEISRDTNLSSSNRPWSYRSTIIGTSALGLVDPM